MKYLVGIGNYTMTDDSIGPRVVEAIANRGLDQKNGFQVLDIGDNGLNLLSYFEAETESMLWVDCVQAGRTAGEVFFFRPEDVVSEKLLANRTTHEGDMLQVLKIAKQMNYVIPKIEIMGIQPASVAQGLSLSSVLADKFEDYVGEAVARISK